MEKSWVYFFVDMFILKPINAHRGQKRPHNFGEIRQAKVEFGKYLKEKCKSEPYQQLPFKYFVKSILISKLLSKVP